MEFELNANKVTFFASDIDEALARLGEYFTTLSRNGLGSNAPSLFNSGSIELTKVDDDDSSKTYSITSEMLND